MSEAAEAVKAVNRASTFAFDFETLGERGDQFNPKKGKIRGMSVATSSGAWYVESADVGGEANLIDSFAPAFLDPEKTALAHNLKFDGKWLITRGIEPQARMGCTMIGAHLLDENLYAYGLKEMVKKIFKVTLPTYEHVSVPRLFDPVTGGTPKTFAEYAKDDARWCLALWDREKVALEKQGMESLFWDIEMPTTRVIQDWELDGVPFSKEFMLEYEGEAKERLTKARAAVFDHIGFEFDLDSKVQLSKVLFERLKLPTDYSPKTKTGYSTKEEYLRRLADDGHEVAALVVEYNKSSTALSKFVRPTILRQRSAGPEDILFGCSDLVLLYPTANQYGTITGRFSYSDPNMQNFPRPNKGQLRTVIQAPPGWLIWAADYSQIELRLMAHTSLDDVLLEAYNQGRDLHQQTADICGCDRQTAKQVNFGAIYGMGPARLVQILYKEASVKISEEDARRILYLYFKRYYGVKAYHDIIEDVIDTKGWVRDWANRRRRLTKRYRRARKSFDRGRAFRMLVNFPTQGGAGSLMKRGMWLVRQGLIDAAPEMTAPARAMFQVHDELVGICREEDRDIVEQVVTSNMESAGKFRVPLKAEIGFGPTWMEAK